jgi:uncharacterized SAM-binding protein YcdF (DUF218 family)
MPSTGDERLIKTFPKLVVGVAALLVFAAVTVRLFVWPDLPPLPPRADAIVELGGPGNRDATALGLAQAGRAPVLAQSTVRRDAGTSRCLPPVPGVTILCFHADPNTTRGEARYIGEMGRLHGWRSVIIVTTPDHAWRARLRVSRCFPGETYVDLAPLPHRWWPVKIPYQWAATLKALILERTC